MLKLAAEHYLSSLGDQNFIPNPNYAEWGNVDCLDIVMKRKSLCRNVIYSYKHFSLYDLWNLKSSENDKSNEKSDNFLRAEKSKYLKEPEQLTADFHWNSKHNTTKELGGKFASLMSLELSAKDEFSITFHMENVYKQSIDMLAVTELLNKKKIGDCRQDFKELLCNKKNKFCIVTQYIYFTKPTEVIVKILTSGKFKPTGTKSQLTIEIDGSQNTENEKKMKFDAGTRLAFKFSKCFINENGNIELICKSEKPN